MAASLTSLPFWQRTKRFQPNEGMGFAMPFARNVAPAFRPPISVGFPDLARFSTSGGDFLPTTNWRHRYASSEPQRAIRPMPAMMRCWTTPSSPPTHSLRIRSSSRSFGHRTRYSASGSNPYMRDRLYKGKGPLHCSLSSCD